jgi:hypothetical protein
MHVTAKIAACQCHAKVGSNTWLMASTRRTGSMNNSKERRPISFPRASHCANIPPSADMPEQTMFPEETNEEVAFNAFISCGFSRPSDIHVHQRRIRSLEPTL